MAFFRNSVVDFVCLFSTFFITRTLVDFIFYPQSLQSRFTVTSLITRGEIEVAFSLFSTNQRFLKIARASHPLFVNLMS